MAEITEPDAASDESDLDFDEHIAVIEIVDPPSRFPIGMTTELEIYVRCPEACDLTGGVVLIGDADDQVVAELFLNEFITSEGVNTTGKFEVLIPSEVGEHTWNIYFFPADDADLEDASEANDQADALLNEAIALAAAPALAATPAAPAAPALAATPASDAATPTPTASDAATPATPAPALFSPDTSTPQFLHAIVQAQFTFTTTQHMTGMAVWRESLPVTIGTEFELNIGVNCVEHCSLLGQNANVYLDEQLLATVPMGEPEAPRNGLYFKKVTLRAPEEIGSYQLTCKMEPEGLELLHAPVQSVYSFTTALQPECLLTVNVLEEKSEKPVDGANISVRITGSYPYHGRSNEAGQAIFNLPWGEYRVGSICADYRDSEETINLTEGMKNADVTLHMYYDPDHYIN